MKPLLLIVTSAGCNGCLWYEANSHQKLMNLLQESGEPLVFSVLKSTAVDPSWEKAFIPPLRDRQLLNAFPAFFLVNTDQWFAQKDDINIFGMYSLGINQKSNENVIKEFGANVLKAETIYGWIKRTADHVALNSSEPTQLVIKGHGLF